MQLIKRFTKSMWESIIADVFPQHLDFHTVTKIFLWNAQAEYLDCFYANPRHGHFRGAEFFLGRRVDQVLPAEVADSLLPLIQDTITIKVPSYGSFILDLEGKPHRVALLLMPYKDDSCVGFVFDGEHIHCFDGEPLEDYCLFALLN
ncbi:MAG: hypothetical protein GKS05_13105 [Nitrospirales bacterium]|nr:hypothetical protein [Nitrospirales bacterium]